MTPGKVYKYQNLKNLSPTKFDFLSKFENTTNSFYKIREFLAFCLLYIVHKKKMFTIENGSEAP